MSCSAHQPKEASLGLVIIVSLSRPAWASAPIAAPSRQAVFSDSGTTARQRCAIASAFTSNRSQSSPTSAPGTRPNKRQRRVAPAHVRGGRIACQKALFSRQVEQGRTRVADGNQVIDPTLTDQACSRAAKYSSSVRVSAVVPDLLDARNTVRREVARLFDSSDLCRIGGIQNDQVEAARMPRQTPRAGPLAPGCFRPSPAEPPSQCVARRDSIARASSRGTSTRMRAGRSSQPSRPRRLDLGGVAAPELALSRPQPLDGRHRRQIVKRSLDSGLIVSQNLQIVATEGVYPLPSWAMSQ